jgi:hypothetical protein
MTTWRCDNAPLHQVGTALCAQPRGSRQPQWTPQTKYMAHSKPVRNAMNSFVRRRVVVRAARASASDFTLIFDCSCI